MKKNTKFSAQYLYQYQYLLPTRPKKHKHMDCEYQMTIHKQQIKKNAVMTFNYRNTSK